ncbi:response regulator [Massilia sp. S19_KUP03_FR1]|uniref:response regulator n=1 Tax=Massilia sp. S19_KUP03_FR1 TaxID=3025503 RepID=UPI002FCDA6E7
MRDHGPLPSLFKFAAIPAWIACALACVAALGYVTGSITLIAFHPGWKAMSPLTALGIAALAVPLMYRWRGHRQRWTALASGVCAIALALLASHLLFHGDVLNPALTRALGIPAALSGKTSVATALCLLLLGGASIARQRRALVPIELLANAALLIAGSALLGYAYDISDLYSYYIFNTMALPTALSMFCLSIAMLLSEPESRLGMAARLPHAGGRRMRHMLALTAVPALLCWALLHLRSFALLNDSFTMALLVMGTSVPMFYLLLEYARTSELLNRAREGQARAQAAQAALLQEEIDRITARLALTHRSEVASLAELERARRTEVIAQLTGSIAHDFNNLLMVIGGSAQLMKLQMPAGHTLMRHVDKIGTTVTASARLTAQLAAFSRTQRLEAEPVAVDEVVRAAINDNLDALPSAIRLFQDMGAPDAWVLGDRAQLQLALGHLLRNASEALGDHGTLRIRTSIERADTREANDTVKISIQDNGCGMSAEVAANATEPFYTTKPGSRHQGLGLAQASSVVHQASGSLHLSSAPGSGTLVDICLPRHTPQGRPLRPGQMEHAPSLTSTGNRRLLVIDDDPEVRSVIVELLRSMHYEVAEAHDGETGLRKLEELQPALAIIDYLMPGMNGGEVARKARQQFPALPILFISGYADSEAIAAIPRAQLLRKPILPKELEKAVSGALAAS